MSEPRGSGGKVAPASLECAPARASLGRAEPPSPAESPVPTVPMDGQQAVGETCDYCGAAALTWRKCKLICGNCSQINKSCADL